MDTLTKDVVTTLGPVIGELNDKHDARTELVVITFMTRLLAIHGHPLDDILDTVREHYEQQARFTGRAEH